MRATTVLLLVAAMATASAIGSYAATVGDPAPCQSVLCDDAPEIPAQPELLELDKIPRDARVVFAGDRLQAPDTDPRFALAPRSQQGALLLAAVSAGVVALLLKLAPIVIPAVLSWAGARWDQYVRAKVKNETLQRILLRVDDALAVAVGAVAQTYVDNLDRDGDGKISAGEAAQARAKAIDEAKRQLGPEAWDEWCALFGGDAQKAEAAFVARLESHVQRLKLLKPGRFEAFLKAVPGH